MVMDLFFDTIQQYLNRDVAFVLFENIQENTGPVSTVAQQSQVRKGSFRCANFTFFLGQFIGCTISKTKISQLYTWGKIIIQPKDKNNQQLPTCYPFFFSNLTRSNYNHLVHWNWIWFMQKQYYYYKKPNTSYYDKSKTRDNVIE